MKQVKRLKVSARNLDPLQNAISGSEVVTRSWLKNGASLTLAQRIGHALMSLVFVGIGIMILRGSIEDFHEDSGMMALYLGVIAVFFMFPGFMGLRNVLRFPGQHNNP